MDPQTGRFISEDPGYHGSNWFSYVNNNPVNLYDPSGEDPLISQEWAIDRIGEILKDIGLGLMYRGRLGFARAVCAMTAILAGGLAAEGVLPGPLKALAIASARQAEALAGRAAVNSIAQFAIGYQMFQLGVIMMSMDDASWVETALDIPNPF
ncbi:MAG: RHS repeat-associated core domain-containing protein, partial [Syntrophobacteraceae bacterium]